MILTHESGSQEDQFDEKKWRQKISWDYPFKYMYSAQPYAYFTQSDMYFPQPYIQYDRHSLQCTWHMLIQFTIYSYQPYVLYM